VGETLAEKAEGTVFRFAAPIVGTEDPKEVWDPGRMIANGFHVPWPREVYADPVIEPVPLPFDRDSWPDLY
jgi:hypothetical protein